MRTLELTYDFKPWTIRYQLYRGERIEGQHSRTVVFVHGTPWSSVVFWPFADALMAQGGYNILLYDLAGYGQSQELSDSDESPAADTSVKTQARLLNDLLAHFEMDGKDTHDAPDIVAHDIAGAIALRTHLIHGCNFRSMLLLDTNAVLPWGDGFYKLVRSEPESFRKLPHGIHEAMVRAVIRSACWNPKNLDAGLEDDLAKPWVSKWENQKYGVAAPDYALEKQQSFVRQIAQANDADVAEMLDQTMYAKVQCPVKIVWGEEDRWIPREKMDQLAEMLKHCLKEFVVVADAGHLVMIDQPVMVASHIFSWLAKQW